MSQWIVFGHSLEGTWSWYSLAPCLEGGGKMVVVLLDYLLVLAFILVVRRILRH